MQDELLRERPPREERPVDVEQIGIAGEEVPRRGRRGGVELFHPARDLLFSIGTGEKPRFPIGVADFVRPATIPFGRQALREGDEERLLLARDPLENACEDFGDVGELFVG